MLRRLLLAVLAAGLVSPFVQAQTPWPKQPIKWVLPFPTGGTVDQISRLLQPFVQQSLGQAIVIDTKAGASGTIGTAFAAKAPADGYTWVMVFDTHGVNPSLIPNLPFDTLKDLAPVMLIGTGAMVVTAHASTPYKSFSDLLQAARSKPGSISYGTIGSGSLAHLAMTSMGNQLKADWTHIPYKGGGPLSTDGIAGHVPVTLATYALWAPHLPGGKLRPLAVTSPKRMAQFPDVAAIAEFLPGYSSQAWFGLFGPARMPGDLARRFSDAARQAVRGEGVRKRIEDTGSLIIGNTPAQFADQIKAEFEVYKKVVTEQKLKLD